MQTALLSRVVAESANLQSGWDTKLQYAVWNHAGRRGHPCRRRRPGTGRCWIIPESDQKQHPHRNRKQQQIRPLAKTVTRQQHRNPATAKFHHLQPVLCSWRLHCRHLKGNLKNPNRKPSPSSPGYAYLKQLQVAKNINWNQVQLAYDKWDYKQEGMTNLAAAVVVIVTVLTYGAPSAPAAAGTVGAAGAGAGVSCSRNGSRNWSSSRNGSHNRSSSRHISWQLSPQPQAKPHWPVSTAKPQFPSSTTKET